MRGRTLVYDVAGLVIHHKQLTVDEVADAFPNNTREQLRKALQNAAAKGLIKCLHNGQRSGVRGCGPSTWGTTDAKKLAVGPARLEKRVPVSVFDLGGVFVPKTAGVRHSPLGGWSDA